MRDRNAPGRPREFDETKALREIMTLFWKGGYEGVSLSMIMKETGLQKASLYAAFGDKRSLYLKALVQYHADVVMRAVAMLKDPTRLPVDRIENFLSAPLDAATREDRSGCFLCNASADQADLNAEVKRQVTRGFEQLTYALAIALAEITPLHEEEDHLVKARALLALYTGLRILVRSGAHIEDLRPSVGIMLEAIKA